MKSGWQHAELNRLLDQNPPDYEALYLANPKYRQETDHIIADTLWPTVKKSTRNSSVRATLGKNEAGVLANIEEEWLHTVTRSLTFILADPERPLGCSSIRWLCRGKIRCSATDYMISFDFYIYLPPSFEMKKILYLLNNPNFCGMPPELSYEQGTEGDGEFVLKFSKGLGAGGGSGLHSYAEVAAEQVFHDVQANLDLIYAVNDLEVDFDRHESFDRLYKALINAYQCN